MQVLEVDPGRNGGDKRCARRSFDEAFSSAPVNRQDHLEFSIRGVPPVDKIPTINSVRAYSLCKGIVYRIDFTFDQGLDTLFIILVDPPFRSQQS